MRFWKREKHNEVIEGSGRALPPMRASTMVSVRFPPEHLERAQAAAEGFPSFSAFVRDAVECVLQGSPVDATAAVMTTPRWSNGSFTCPHFSVSNVSAFNCFACERES